MDQKKIGSFLRELRKEKGFTQDELAEKMGVSRKTVSRWETGNNLPDISLLVKLADLYDIDVREITAGERISGINEEINDVADEMANYAGKEKNRILKCIQAVGFAGIFFLTMAIVLQSIETGDSVFGRATLIATCVALALLVIITLYVINILDRNRKAKRAAVILKRIAIVWACLVVLCILALPSFGINVFKMGIKEGFINQVDSIEGYYIGLWKGTYYHGYVDGKEKVDLLYGKTQNYEFTPDWTQEAVVDITPFKKYFIFSKEDRLAQNTFLLVSEDTEGYLGKMHVIRSTSGKIYYYYERRRTYDDSDVTVNPCCLEENITFIYDGKEIHLEDYCYFSSDVDFTTGEHVLYMKDLPLVFIDVRNRF